ncbi:MAG: hypothetical protein IJZ53_13560 [Tyzzerella sp.]|nr:hypothetical protein [Tyzzerella sp.]
MLNFNDEFQYLRKQMGLDRKKVQVSDEKVKELEQLRREGKQMPEGFSWHMEGGKYIYHETVPNEVGFEDKIEYLMMKQLSCINIIKNCVVFITVIVAVAASIFILPLFF